MGTKQMKAKPASAPERGADEGSNDLEVMRRRAELAERMLEREVHLRETILWHLPLVLVTSTAEGEILFANACAGECAGLSSRELLGSSFLDRFVGRESRALVERQLRELPAADRPLTVECFLPRTAAGSLQVSWQVLRVAGPSAEPDLIVYAGRIQNGAADRPRQLRERQRLRALGQMASGMAHGFNGVLQSIQGNVSLMLAEIDEFVNGEIQRGAEMTRKLLAAEGAEMHSEPSSVFDVNERVRATAEMFARARRDLVLQLDLSAEAAAFEGCVSDLDQVVLDLLIHAGGHLKRGGRITVRTVNEASGSGGGDSARSLVLLVEDSGPFEMPPRTRRRWTGPRNGAAGNDGMGLAPTAQLVGALGGELESSVDSVQGNVLRLQLPLSGERPARTSLEAPACQSSTPSSVLLIDDEQVMRDVGQRILSRLGYAVTTAVGGREGLALFARQPSFDLVILDLVMPDLPGREVLPGLLQLNPEVKVLVASGYSTDDEAQKMAQMGARGFLQKPFRMQQLEEVVRRLLADSD